MTNHKTMDIWLPSLIENAVHGIPGQENDTGMSGARIIMFPDKVLKIQKDRPWAAREAEMLRWLSGKIPVPEVIAYEKQNGMSFLLMTRIMGKMACDDTYLNNPVLLIRRLAEAVQMLWAIDTSDCPIRRDPETELAEAEYRVVNHLVDMDNTEPYTFGPNGFRDPEALLEWLKANRPDDDPVLSHGDFCLPNIFLNERGISGFIDLGDSGVGDRYRDLALCERSFRHNLDGTYGKRGEIPNTDMLYEILGIRPDREKIRWYLLLDELF